MTRTDLAAPNSKRSLLGPRAGDESDLKWVRLIAGLVSFLGIAGFLALLSQGAWAAPDDARPGLRPGNRTFTNPFANTGNAPAGGRGAFFDDDNEDEVNVPQRTQNGGSNRVGAGGGNPAISVNAAANAAGANLTGQPSGGVITKREVSAIHVDSETGDGSKELVTDFNFPDADIMDIAKTLGKLTGKNFILDKDVKGRVSIVSNSAITVGDAWRAFLTALDMTGFALVPSGKYIRITRQRDARDKQLRTYTGEASPDTDALITRVFTLKYIDSEEVARTFRSFMPANSRIIPYDQTNTVIVTDTGANISKLAKMLELLDVEGYDLGIEVVPVKFASAADLSKLIDQLIPGQGAGNPNGGAPRFGGSGRFNARRTKEGGVINTIIADERTNTMIVNANSKGVEQVRELVARLDQKVPAQQGGGKVHVKYLQFADAEAVAGTLNGLTSGGGAGGPRPILSTPGGLGTGVNPVSQSLFEGNIKVSPDKATNSLVVTASPADFEKIEQVVNRLDIPRDEVYVEIVIMEVALQNTFNYSSSVASPSSGIALTPNNDLLNWVQNPLAVNGAVLGFKSTGTTPVMIGGVSQPIPNVAALVNAIQTNSKSNVLATPQIVALDNEDATFESTEKLPITKSTAVQGAGVSTSVDYIQVPLSIKIKPQINRASNFVKLKITTKVSDVENRKLPSAVEGQAYATLERNAETSVFVGDSDTVVIGGLIRDKINDSVSKIPLLGDIPVLGWLFRAKTSAAEKTNLVIFLTPHIVRKYEKIRAILDRKLKERDDFIEKEAGGEDPHRGVRDDMIRRLPDLKSLSQERPTAFSVGGADGTPAAVPVTPDAPNTRPVNPPGANPPGNNPTGNVPPNAPAIPAVPPTAPGDLNAPPGPPPAAPPADAVPPPPPAPTT